MVLAQHAHHLLGLGRLGEGGEAAQVEEHDGDLAAVALQRILGAAGDDQLGELRREEALEPRQPLELGDLLAHALLQRRVPVGELAAWSAPCRAALDAQQRAHAREQLGLVDRLGEEVVGAGLDALDALLLRDRAP